MFRHLKTGKDIDNAFYIFRNLSKQPSFLSQSETSTQSQSLEESAAPQKPEIALNLLIDACITHQQVEKAVNFIEDILKGTEKSFVRPDEVTFNTLLKGCAIKKMLYKSYDLFQVMKKVGLHPNQVTFNTLIEVYVRCGKQDHAWSLLAEMKQSKVKPDNYTLSSLIKGIKPDRDYWNQNGNQPNCTLDSRVSRVMELVDKMYKRPGDFGDKPDEILYNCLLDLCVRYKDTRTAVKVFEQMKYHGLKPSSVTFGILIKAFGLDN